MLASPSGGSFLLAINSAVNSVSRIAMGLLGLSLVADGLCSDAPRERFLAFVVMYGIYAAGTMRSRRYIGGELRSRASFALSAGWVR
ncbi:hypothetical protein C8R44DRAFT_886690 [Mycena epipterygia]|nr:hypothetical protein C8R44DRAFT_886690 [Mycena epipterygia]